MLTNQILVVMVNSGGIECSKKKLDSQLKALADLRGEDARDTRSPGPNSFNFMQFVGRNWPNNNFSHLPPLGNYWIQH